MPRPKSKARDDAPSVADLVHFALAEDIGDGDITGQATIAAGRKAEGRVVAKAHGVVAGVGIAEEVFRAVDPATKVGDAVRDGATVAPGDLVFTVSGSARSLVAAERTALNFLQRLSGVATLTSQFVAQVAGTKTRIIDTRKTTPGWRVLDKRAVVAGGGLNHRMGLFDMVLIKENHVRAVGGIGKAVRACRRWIDDKDMIGVAVEVETTNLDEVREALEAKCDRIMLDNMPVDEMRKAVSVIRERKPYPEIEASGNVTLENARAIAESGVDFISVGAMTHSAPVLDVSLLFTK